MLPVIGTAALTSWATAWTATVTWFKTRTSVEEVQPLIVDVNLIAKAGQSQAHTNHADIQIQRELTSELARAMIELHAQAEVDRAYASNKRRSEYIERAKRFYMREFDRLLAEYPNHPSEAIRLTRLAVWRPDRDD